MPESRLQRTRDAGRLPIGYQFGDSGQSEYQLMRRERHRRGIETMRIFSERVVVDSDCREYVLGRAYRGKGPDVNDLSRKVGR